jgi:hypothetical protein
VAPADNNRESREERSRIYKEVWTERVFAGIERSNHLIGGWKTTTPPERLLHFAPASAVASILPSRTLRISRARSSNDPKELAHGIAIAMEEEEKWPSDEFAIKFREELRASFEGRLTNGIERHTIDPHICCFTETESADLVAHWAMYGRDGSGFALSFKGKALDQIPGVDLVKVRYDEKEQRAHMRELVAIARETSLHAATYALTHYGDLWSIRCFTVAAHFFGGIISLHASMMKAKEFSAENEWRLIYAGPTDTDVKAGIEAKGPILRTHFDVRFEPSALAAIIIGPVHADLNRPVVYRLLKEHDYSETAMETGTIALRTLRDQ